MGKNTYKDEDEYRRRRERNNEAVKKSRVKSKLRSQATHERVQQLQMENTKLEEKIGFLASEVEFLKDMLCANHSDIKTEDSNRVQTMLNDEMQQDHSMGHNNPPTGNRRLRK
ncbi:Hypothetical predicted protein [Cloeon dipterum]|uniref:BZIP domain-containing protein n=1 Tax=Cloeon dipterum TaxID=197152 RepID=A0A8S1C7N5_9INSE|nr:Hypothetical predicted protein [Cloeon dipterum]